jgi:hypothetical protein
VFRRVKQAQCLAGASRWFRRWLAQLIERLVDAGDEALVERLAFLHQQLAGGLKICLIEVAEAASRLLVQARVEVIESSQQRLVQPVAAQRAQFAE